MDAKNLVVVTGQEGVGKSTIVPALLPHTSGGARIDAEDVGQVNPCPMDAALMDLVRRNVAGLAENFWDAGYVTVIAGSFINTYSDYVAFRRHLQTDPRTYVIQLCAPKTVRDGRRRHRAKQTSREWRDHVDRVNPEDTTLRDAAADYRYVRVDNGDLTVADTVSLIRRHLPEIYGS